MSATPASAKVLRVNGKMAELVTGDGVSKLYEVEGPADGSQIPKPGTMVQYNIISFADGAKPGRIRLQKSLKENFDECLEEDDSAWDVIIMEYVELRTTQQRAMV